MVRVLVSVVLLTIAAGACGAARSEQPLPAGSAASDGQLTFTAGALTCSREPVEWAWTAEKPIGQFCALDVTVTNTGNEPRTFHAGVQRLVDAAGDEHAADFGASWVESTEWPATVLNPGTRTDLRLVFDVATSAVPVAVELHDSAFSAGVRVQLSGPGDQR